MTAPPFNDDSGHDYGRIQTRRRVNKGRSVMTWAMILHQQRAARSLPCRISARANKTDPALANEIKTLLTTPTEHNGGPPRVSKAKASELISRAFDK